MAWYTLQTIPNYENKVVEQLWQKIKEHDAVQVREIFSPEETIIEFKNGQKKEKKKKLYSNYIFIEMDYDDVIWHKIRQVKGLKTIIGGAKPTKVSESQIEEMKSKIAQSAPKPKVNFDVDAKIKITSGNFADFYGIIKEVNYEKNKAKIMLNIFGRETAVELELSSIELAQ